MKNEKGITIVSLIVTIMVLAILAGIGIGSMKMGKGSIDTATSEIMLYDLYQTQQVVLETYLKYKQTGGQTALIGSRLTWNEANDALGYIRENCDDSIYILNLVQSDYGDSAEDAADWYYGLVKQDLINLGLQNINLEDLGLSEDDSNTVIYVVNYSTGEVFNKVVPVTSKFEPLYINTEK